MIDIGKEVEGISEFRISKIHWALTQGKALHGGEAVNMCWDQFILSVSFCKCNFPVKLG